MFGSPSQNDLARQSKLISYVFFEFTIVSFLVVCEEENNESNGLGQFRIA